MTTAVATPSAPTPATPAGRVPERPARLGDDDGLAGADRVPELLLRQLEWRVLRRLDGRLQGAYRTVAYGSSLDFAGLRDYAETDDARRIDWNSTARMPEPQVRQYTADRELTAWLVLDRSASMAVGRPGRAKHDVLAELSLLLARLFSQGGNRVGAVLYDGRQTKIVPPATGRRQVLRIGCELGGVKAGAVEPANAVAPAGRRRRRGVKAGAVEPSAALAEASTPARSGWRTGALTATRRRAKPSTAEAARGTDLAGLLTSVDAMASRRSLVLVVSDFVGAGLEPADGAKPPWEDALLRLRARHEVACLRVADPADNELPVAGTMLVEDAETGERLLVDTADPLFRARLAARADARRAALDQTMRRLGVPFHAVDTGEDIVDALVRVVADTKARR